MAGIVRAGWRRKLCVVPRRFARQKTFFVFADGQLRGGHSA